MYEALHDKVPGSIPARRLKFRITKNSEALPLPGEGGGGGSGGGGQSGKGLDACVACPAQWYV